MPCGKCGGFMYVERSICNGQRAVDMACIICGMRDSPEIRKNRAEVRIENHKID